MLASTRTASHTEPMAAVRPPGADKHADGQDDGQAEILPATLGEARDAFIRHLAAERSLSRHTVRAYQGDVQSLLEYAHKDGIESPGELDLATLRGWLAQQHQAGAARASLARRGAAARAFTAYAHRQGWLEADPGPQLGKTAQDPPGPASGAQARRDEPGPGRLRGPGPARGRRRPAGSRRAGYAGRRRPGAAVRDRDPGQRALRPRRRPSQPGKKHDPGARQGRQGAR